MGRRYYIMLGILAVLFILVNAGSPKSVNWKPNYKYNDKNPYGSEVTYKLMEDIFGKDNLDHNNFSPYDYLKNNDQNFNILYVASVIPSNDLDKEAIMEFAEKGNNVFIAANYFSGPLADTLGLQNQGNHSFGFGPLDSITLSFTNTKFERKEYGFQFDNIFTYVLPDTTKERDYIILSESSDFQPHFIQVPVGKGNIFYHTNPQLFTNYNLLHAENQHKYISNCLSYLPKHKTVWNQFYSNQGSAEEKGEMRFILKDPRMRWAYNILIAFIVVFLLFQSKRRQRAIPIINPPVNSTLEFVETTGRLFFQQKNHLNLAHKKIAFFLEKIRNKFYVNTTQLDDGFTDVLAAKSGVPQQEIKELIKFINSVRTSERITESTLLELNKKIEEFYNKASM